MIHPAALIHDKALVDPGATIGAQTRVWGFTHILSGARIGADCNICEQVFVENDVVIGDRVTVKCGVQLWDGIRLEDDVFVGPNVTFTNDRFPRSKRYPAEFLTTTVKAGASIGGGGGDTAGADDRGGVHGRRRGCCDTLGAGRRHCGRQPGTDCWSSGGFS